MKHLIITDNPGIADRIIEINKRLGIDQQFDFATSPYSEVESFSFPLASYDLRNEQDIEQLAQYDLIISCHCKQLFPATLIQKHRCYNLHPGYNPINRGWYPQVFSILHDLPVGATFHQIDEKLDHGDIVDRKLVDKKASDTSYTLYTKIVNSELELWEKNILSVLENKVDLIVPENEGNLYLKKDFNKLLELDLTHQGSLADHLKLLRSLTFNGYKNAFFVDENGKKVFVEIALTEEDA